jgi:hypothetical protein
MADNPQEAPTAEEIDHHYAACLDSVTAITEGLASGDTGAVERNVGHLEIMVAKDFWSPEHDMAPLIAAVAAANP